MRVSHRLIAAAFACLWLAGAGQPAPHVVVMDSADRALLDKVSAYLNAIHTLKSGFIQINPDHQFTEGTFYLQKPGQLRFEYHPPSPVLMVATGGKIYVKNARLNTVDHYDLSDTPLGLLLDDNIDLKRNSAVLGVEEQGGAIIVHARTATNRNSSNITLVFSAEGPELRQWMVKDNQGGETTVALNGLTSGVPLDPALFAVPVKAPAIKP